MRSWHWLAIVAVVAIALVVTVVVDDGAREHQTSRSTVPASVPTDSAPSDAGGDDTGVVPEGEQAVPTRIRIPAIQVSSALDALRTSRSGALEAPPRWQVAGWFAAGTRPGDTGPAVIAGHIDSPDGPAVFARLSELTRGDMIEIERGGSTTVRYRVDRTQVVGKHEFPTSAVYGPTPDAQLRLITCDGPYVESSGGYQDNLIVFATEVST